LAKVKADKMTVADRWLLPDGVEEILPQQAQQIEALRRQILDLYHRWGYGLVIPPMIEFQESLLIGLGKDVDLQTFKVTDQTTGRTLAIRADITPQTARIDAHSLCQDGPTRLCYAGTVLHTKAKALMASRAPIEVGAELYGEAGIAGDVEVISLMLETLKQANISQLHLDLGHVGIYRALSRAADLSIDVEQQIFDVLQRKASTELSDLVLAHVAADYQDWFLALPHFHGDVKCLAKAAAHYANGPNEVLTAIADLQAVATRVSERAPDVTLYFDLSELRGYHYHTGLVFAAFVPGEGRAVANGGRYDNVGEVFGRARPATGFSTDLKNISRLSVQAQATSQLIFAPFQVAEDLDGWNYVQNLRAQGECVEVGLSGSQSIPAKCDRVIKNVDGQWQLIATN
jgi:ATP phosphoribosyltransferase regulatory subunit